MMIINFMLAVNIHVYSSDLSKSLQSYPYHSRFNLTTTYTCRYSENIFNKNILCIFRPSSHLRSKGEKWTTFTTDKRHFPK